MPADTFCNHSLLTSYFPNPSIHHNDIILKNLICHNESGHILDTEKL